MEFWTLVLACLVSAAIAVAGTAALSYAGLRAIRRADSPPGATPASVVASPALPYISPDELAHLRGELNAVRAEWKAHQKQLDAYLEAYEDLEESVERRRKRSAASRSKMEAIESQAQPELDPNSREAIRARARARGFRV